MGTGNSASNAAAQQQAQQSQQIQQSVAAINNAYDKIQMERGLSY